MPAPKKAKPKEPPVKMSFYASRELAIRLRHLAVDKDLKITELIGKYVEDGLAREGSGEK
jgi:hypothetical protein